ncbi:hypothetical protein KCU73_g14525, partial [Aureobasidium melanogenum]
LVHVEFRRKFSEKFTLKDLQKFSQPGGALAGMELFKQSRLSVTKVTKPQWDFIMSQVDEDDDEMEDFNGSMVEEGTEIDGDTTDLGNDFAAAFEAPVDLHTAADGTPDGKLPNSTVSAPGSSARSVSRGRRSRPMSVPAGKSAALHDATLPTQHKADAPSN